MVEIGVVGDGSQRTFFGEFADLPTGAVTDAEPGSMYLASDTKQVFIWTGTAWVEW